MIEGTVMNRAETQTVFGFVGPAFVLNGNDVSGVEKIQLDVTCRTAMPINGKNILAKTSVTNLPLNLLKHHSSWTCRNVSNVRRIRVRDLRHSQDVLRMLRATMECFELDDVGRKKLRRKCNGDFIILPGLGIKLRCLGVLQSFPANLERR